jgi:hypothetical protein
MPTRDFEGPRWRTLYRREITEGLRRTGQASLTGVPRGREPMESGRPVPFQLSPTLPTSPQGALCGQPQTAGVRVHPMERRMRERQIGGRAMALRLNQRAFDHAKGLIKQKRVELDVMDDWSEHQPSAAQENTFIEEHRIGEYGKWHLGVDEEQDEENKGRYKFPYGDFQNVHRCGVIAAEVRAAQRKYTDIESAAAHLHGMLDGLM